MDKELDRKQFEAAMIAAHYPENLFEGFFAEGEYTYYDRKANQMFDAWAARAPLVAALEQIMAMHKFNVSATVPAEIHALCFNALFPEVAHDLAR